jgi:amidophosphoribosyltransferase
MNDRLQEKCAVFGIFNKNIPDAARIVHAGLWALQHRGQESSGISATNGKRMRTHKAQGLVAHVYEEKDLDYLVGHISIGHNRYSTSGGSTDDHSQPVIDNGNTLSLAHNGNLPSVNKLIEFLKSKRVSTDGLNDSELMHAVLLWHLKKGKSIEEAIDTCYPLFTGVFSLLVMTKDKMVALRDSSGIRPLSLGKLNGGFVVASETCAIDTVNAQYLRDVAPGEMIVFNKNGMRSHQLSKGKETLDIFEFVYFARPDSILLGKRVNEVRREFGRQLARENKIKADVVIPVPDSAIPAALGYSEESGIRIDTGFIKNRYIHRTFIRPAQKLREKDVMLKLNPLPEVIKGKRVIVIDDSIVRGTTSKKLVAMLRNAGAKEVHLLVSSPPVKFPDFYGIDTPKQKDLIASHMTVAQIQEFVGADSVRFLSYEGLIASTGLPEHNFCTSCFTGIYPVDIAERALEIKYPEKPSQRSTFFAQS